MDPTLRVVTSELQVRALLGMLHQLGDQGWTELKCSSHVSYLLAKLSHGLRANFRRFVNPNHTPYPTLLDLADWLKYEVGVQKANTVATQIKGGKLHAKTNALSASLRSLLLSMVVSRRKSQRKP